jgi:DNA-binding MarR family transcriptional regulator
MNSAKTLAQAGDPLPQSNGDVPVLAMDAATAVASTATRPASDEFEGAAAVVAGVLPNAPVGCSNFKLRQATRVVSRHYDAVMASATGLKTSQYSLLSHIDKLGPLQPSDLAAHMALEPSTLSRNLQPLIAQGWVQVGPGSNQRSRTLTLSDAGRVKRAEAKSAWKAAQLAFNARLGVERVARLHELLDECLALMADDAGSADNALALASS